MSFAYAKATINNPTVTTVNGSAALSGVSSVAGWFVGALIEGAGIPAGTTIESFSGTGAVISAAATASATLVATVSSERITQTGTDTSWAGIAGMATVTAFATGNENPAMYVLNRGQILVNGTLTITREILCLGRYAEYAGITLGAASVVKFDGTSGAAGLPHLSVPALIFNRPGSGGFSNFALGVAVGAKLTLKNCEIRASQSVNLQNISTANLVFDGDVKFLSYRAASDGIGTQLILNAPTFTASGLLYITGGFRIFVYRSDSISGNPLVFNAVTDGIGSFQNVANLRFVDANFLRNAGSGLVTRRVCYGYLRNPVLGSEVAVNPWASGGDNVGGYAISRYVGHSVKNTGGVAVQGAVIYAGDTNNGSRGNPSAYIGLLGSDAAVFDGTADKNYLWQTDATGSAPAQDVYTAFKYTPDGDATHFVRDYRTKGGIAGVDLFDFSVLSYGYFSQTGTVDLKGSGTLAPTWNLLADPSVTLPELGALAKLAAAFSLDTDTHTLTVTELSTLDDLHDAMKAYKTRNVKSQIEYGGVGKLLFSPNGSTLVSTLNIVGAHLLSVGAKFTRLSTTGTVDVSGGLPDFVLTSAAGTSAILTLREIVPGSAIAVLNGDVGDYVADHAGGTYTLPIAPGAVGTYTWVVNKAGYTYQYGTFTPGVGGEFDATPVLTEKRHPDGSAMYQGTTSPLVSVSFDGTTRATIDVGDGAVEPQTVLDECEAAGQTLAGLLWLTQRDEISFAKLPGSSNLFLTADWRLRRASAGDVNAGVLGYVYSTQGAVVDGTNGSVAFMVNNSAAELAAAVMASLAASTIPVDVRRMNGAQVIGTGAVGDGWRGVGVSP